MCRLFAFRSTGPLCGQASLCAAGNSLAAQSRRDARGESHRDGWGLASFDGDGRPHVTKSLQAACDDRAFDDLARSVVTTTLVVHVRQASVGNTALENTHPFVHGRWVFAHNGTLEDFAARKGPLLSAIPDDLRQMIRGDTDSEHVFLFWLIAGSGRRSRPIPERRHDHGHVSADHETPRRLVSDAPGGRIEVQFRCGGRTPAGGHTMGARAGVPGAPGQRCDSPERSPAACGRDVSRRGDCVGADRGGRLARSARSHARRRR